MSLSDAPARAPSGALHRERMTRRVSCRLVRMSQTLPRVDVATAMLVALDDKVAGACIAVLDDAGFRVVRVKHVAPACERLPVVMPHLVVAPTGMRRDEEDMLVDRCVAVGAEVLRLAPEVDAQALSVLVANAAHVALEKAR